MATSNLALSTRDLEAMVEEQSDIIMSQSNQIASQYNRILTLTDRCAASQEISARWAFLNTELLKRMQFYRNAAYVWFIGFVAVLCAVALGHL